MELVYVRAIYDRELENDKRKHKHPRQAAKLLCFAPLRQQESDDAPGNVPAEELLATARNGEGNFWREKRRVTALSQPCTLYACLDGEDFTPGREA